MIVPFGRGQRAPHLFGEQSTPEGRAATTEGFMTHVARLPPHPDPRPRAEVEEVEDAVFLVDVVDKNYSTTISTSPTVSGRSVARCVRMAGNGRAALWCAFASGESVSQLRDRQLAHNFQKSARKCNVFYFQRRRPSAAKIPSRQGCSE